MEEKDKDNSRSSFMSSQRTVDVRHRGQLMCVTEDSSCASQRKVDVRHKG